MSTFNPDLIQKARKGEIAIKHDGTIEELREILEAVFPNDWTTSNICAATTRYFVAKPFDKTLWVAESDTDLPAHSVKDFFMPDTNKLNLSPQKQFSDIVEKGAEQPRTYKVTRGQMKEIWKAYSGTPDLILQVVGSWFGVFDDEIKVDGVQMKDLLDCYSEPYPDILRQTFPEYFYIPEGEPVLVRSSENFPWVLRISDGQGNAYVNGHLSGNTEKWDQIIPFTKNPPK